MVQYKLQNELADWCECGRAKVTHQKTTHGVKKHDIRDVNHSVLLQVDEMTRLDQDFYVRGLQIFLQEVRLLQIETGKVVLCPEMISSLLDKTGYIPDVSSFFL